MKLNDRLAGGICRAVGTMGCAYAFAALALLSAPAAFGSRSLVVIVQWLSGAFIQLVLLPVIIVGQNLQAQRADDHTDLLRDVHGATVAGSPHADPEVGQAPPDGAA